jgi:hypothetical protein
LGLPERKKPGQRRPLRNSNWFPQANDGKMPSH